MKMRRFFVIGSALAALVCGISGCGGDSFNRVPLSGTVTWDGEGSPSGSMTLTPAVQGTGAPNTSAVITDGKFSFVRGQEPAPGQYMFEVNLRVPLPGNITLSPEDAHEAAGNFVSYRKQLDVPAGGSSSFAIELTAADKVRADADATESRER